MLKIFQKHYIVSSITLFILVLPFLFYSSTFRYPFSENSADWANLGSFYGGLIGPFLSLSAFLALLYTIDIQIKQLRQQEKVNTLQLKQLKRQEENYKEQKATARVESFETTLFKLIELNMVLINSLEAKCNGNFGSESSAILKGQALITHLYGNLNRRLDKLSIEAEVPFDYNFFNENYESFYKRYSHVLGHFCRSTYTILKFIDESPIENKKFYCNIFKSTLSNHDFGLLAFNSLSSHGSKLKLLIEKYGFLQNFYEESMIWKRAREEFDETAFL